MPQPDASATLAEFIVAQPLKAIPEHALRTVRHGIADTVGVILAGSTTASARAVRRVAALDAAGGSSTVIGAATRMPAVAAGMCNGSAAHQFDFDDTHDAGVVHPTANSLPAALALAELDPRANGADLLAAVAVGNEITCRLGSALTGNLFDYPWTRPPILGTFGAAAAAARILGLDAGQTRSALGLALHQTCNTLECLYAPGSEVRGLRDGFSVRNGMTAALMAREGIIGDSTALEGRFGLFNAFFRGDYDRARLLDGLGQRFDCADVSIKPWPSARETHATIHCALELREGRALTPDRIGEIVLTVGQPNLEFCEPGDQRRRPARRMDALSSLPFAVSVAFVKGRVGLESYTDPALRDAAVLAMAQRVRWELDPSISEGTIEGGRVTVRLTDGTTLSNAVRHGLGHPGEPLPEPVRRAKFADCANRLDTPPGAERIGALFDALGRIDRLSLDALREALL